MPNPLTFFLGSKVKLVLALVVLGLFVALALTARHYHNLYIQSQIDLGKVTMVKDTAIAAAESCSKATEKLRLEGEEREAQAKIDIEAAQKESAKNKSFAGELLTKTPKIPSTACPEGDKVINDYLLRIKGESK